MAQWVRTGEAARALGVHPRTLQRWVTAGRIRPHRRTLGGQARWDVERLEREVDELLAQGDPEDDAEHE